MLQVSGMFFMWDALTQSFKIKHELKNDIILRFRTDIKINSKKLNLNLDDIMTIPLYT